MTKQQVLPASEVVRPNPDTVTDLCHGIVQLVLEEQSRQHGLAIKAGKARAHQRRMEEAAAIQEMAAKRDRFGLLTKIDANASRIVDPSLSKVLER